MHTTSSVNTIAHTTNKKLNQFKIAFALLAGGLSLSLIMTLSSWATSQVTGSYIAEAPIAPGIIVGLKPDTEEVVEPAQLDSGQVPFGVVTSSNNSGLRLQREGSNVFVTTLGPAQAFVSDINGPIKAGQELSLSIIAGVAQKANSRYPIVGIALENFDENSPVLTAAEIPNSEDVPVGVNIGAIDIQVQPRAAEERGGLALLTSFGETIAGKPVSPVRLFLALGVLTVAMFSSVGLLFSAVRNAIISIGRNPLSKSSIFRGLLQVSMVVVVVFVAGLVGSYIILRY